MLAILIVLGVLTGLIAAGNHGVGPIVITKEGEQYLILSFLPPRAVTEPGWSLRFPLVEEAVRFDSRLL